MNLADLIQTIAIDSVSAPSKAEINETISIDITLNHSFVFNTSSGAKREIYVGLYDSDQGGWINGVSDEVGIELHQNIAEETLIYTLVLTTPQQADTYNLEARVYYQKDDEWYYNKQGYLKNFTIQTVQKTEPEPGPSPTPEPKPRGIPGFTTESVILGLMIGVCILWITRRLTRTYYYLETIARA